MEGIRVLVVDDHAVFAQTLAAALGAEDSIAIVGVAGNGTDALRLAEAERPDVVLVDYRLPDISGAALIMRLVGIAPDARIVVLTASADERTLVDALEAGCTAYVTKDQTLDDVIEAVRAAAVGESVIPPSLLALVLPRVRRGNRGPSSALTSREREVLAQVALGLSNQQIAERLYVSLNTVRNHVRNILSKLNAHSKLEAVAIATREGLVSPEVAGG